jgi:hypothetical protein
LAGEFPVDLYVVAIDLPVPCAGFFGQSEQVRDAAFSQALAGEEADLDFGLVQPASML